MVDEWAFNDDQEDSYEYGYDYLYEESENRPANPEADEAEEDREDWWETDEDAQIEQIRSEETDALIDDADEWQDDEPAEESEPEQLAYAEILAEIRAEQAQESSAAKAKKMLVREMKAEALSRMEHGARTKRDFKAVTEVWDHLDRNRERWERDHEILCEEPADGVTDYSRIWAFPRWRCDPTERQIQSGNFLGHMYDCPYEMHNLIGRRYLSPCVQGMKDDHKEILYFLYLRLFSPQRVAAMRGQTDRNIRKVRDVALRKLRKKVYFALSKQVERGYPYLTLQEREFLEAYQAKEGAEQHEEHL